MYGLVEVNLEIIRKAYRFLESDPSLNVDKKEEEKPFKNVKEALLDNKCIFTEEQLRFLNKVLSEIVYASYLSSSPTMLIKIEIAGIIQDLIEFYEDQPEQVA